MDLIGLYINLIRQQHPGGTIIWKKAGLTCMTMIDPATGWFKIVKLLTFNLDEETSVNYEYIDKSSDGFVQVFNNTWLCRYPHPRKVVFDNGYKFKQDFTPLLKGFNIKTVLMSVKNPQSNAPVERVH